MPGVQARWKVLRFIARIQVFFAWVNGVVTFFFGVAGGLVQLNFLRGLEGVTTIIFAILFAVLVWVTHMAIAEGIRLFISIEGNVRNLAQRSESPS